MSFAKTQPYQKNFRPGFVGDYLDRSRVLPGGIKVDYRTFENEDAVVIIPDGNIAAGSTQITLEDPLTGDIPAGEFLNFGVYAPVTVTVNDADVNAAETSFAVLALSGPIPAGTILRFGAGVYARLSAAADTGAVSLTVEALPADIANSATATFAGGTIQARVTTDASEGDEDIDVDELQFGLSVSNIAYYEAPGSKKRVAAGRLVGITNATLESSAASGAVWHKALDTDDIVRILAYDIYDPQPIENGDGDVLRPGNLIRVNHMPGWAELSSTLKGKVRTAYETTVGAPGQEVPAS